MKASHEPQQTIHAHPPGHGKKGLGGKRDPLEIRLHLNMECLMWFSTYKKQGAGAEHTWRDLSDPHIWSPIKILEYTPTHHDP